MPSTRPTRPFYLRAQHCAEAGGGNSCQVPRDAGASAGAKPWEGRSYHQKKCDFGDGL